MDIYIDANGVERCDNCGDAPDGCACYCSECGDHATDCACEDGPTLPPVADWARAALAASSVDLACIAVIFR